MIIIEDTRNQVGKHKNINMQLDRLGHSVIRSKMLVGDYTLPTDQSVCIDTKSGLQEVVGNVTKQHERFRSELTLARDCGIELIILIEEENVKCLKDVNMWYNPRLRTSKVATKGTQLFKIMYSLQEKYGVKFQFCNKRQTGRIIAELLNHA